MSFTDSHGAPHSTTGVIGALAIAPDGAEGPDAVLPHEQTMSKPKGDRLNLLRATRTNTSPIWGLSLSHGLTDACEAATGGSAAPKDAHDDAGVRHELWTVADPAAVERITALVGESPVLIADGHHRYETAIAYRGEVREANGDSPNDADLIMALIVELAEEELFVRPINRLLKGSRPAPTCRPPWQRSSR